MRTGRRQNSSIKRSSHVYRPVSGVRLLAVAAPELKRVTGRDSRAGAGPNPFGYAPTWNADSTPLCSVASTCDRCVGLKGFCPAQLVRFEGETPRVQKRNLTLQSVGRCPNILL